MAAIVNAWIDATPWMERDLPPAQIEALISDGMALREIWVICTPVAGYIPIEVEIAHIWGFYCARTGQGLGKRLLDQAKQGRDFLSLNTHLPNLGAQRFYVREGFQAVGQHDAGPVSTAKPVAGQGAGGPREMRMEWRS